MNYRNLLLLLLTFCLTATTFAQKRSTSVKGYYRKNGTYVRPHTRTYNAGNGTTSSSYYSSSYNTNKTEKDSIESIPENTLSLIAVEKTDYEKTTSKYSNRKNNKISASSLTTVKTTGINSYRNIDDNSNIEVEQKNTEVETSNQNGNSKNENKSDGVTIYLSVLRYNGKTIDICPVTRGILGNWDFDKTYHSFEKSLISTDDALDLVSNFGWRIKEDKISKDYSYSYNDKGLPKYLTKTIEAMKLK